MVSTAVAVCIPTRDRPAGLRRALDSVLEQAAEVFVVVADNSSHRSAEELCRQHPMAPTYVHEPRPGVSHVRNLLMETADGMGADVVLFLDDDMVLGQSTVSSFLDAATRYPECVLTGPVTYSSESSAVSGWSPPTRGPHLDGELLDVTGTGNTWIPLQVWRRHGCPLFDPDFGLTGGEDTEFFHRLTAQGAMLRWCVHAESFELVSPDRATQASLAQRYQRAGYVNGRLALRTRGRSRVLALGALRVVVGLALWPAPRVLGSRVSNPRATFHSGIGHLRAAIDRPPGHYGRGMP